MSSDDPTDDELEAEARRDSPLAAGGSRHHSPKLGEVPGYAVDLRAMRPMLEAEREASDARMGHAGPEPGRFDWPERPRRQAQREAPGDRMAPSPLRALQGGRQASRQAESDAVVPTPYSPEAQAWDRFAAAALPLVAVLEVANPELEAALVADRLLEQRRRRFG